jgi:hypothetical protein
VIVRVAHSTYFGQFTKPVIHNGVALCVCMFLEGLEDQRAYIPDYSRPFIKDTLEVSTADSFTHSVARSPSSHFSAFDARTRSARELLRQVQAKRFKHANPRLKIGINVHDRADAPKAHFTFIDGTEVS